MARIMIVDDEKDVVTLIKFILEKDGHEVTTAYNGAEALKTLGVIPPLDDVTIPELIILDVMMPIMDGYAVCTALTGHPATQSIPVLILTAKGAMRDLFNQSTNVASYIDKPFDPKKLRELISGILSGVK